VFLGENLISAGDFRNGITFEVDGAIVSVVEFQHVKPGKGSAFVRAKLKNIVSGGTIERTFNPNEKFQEAFIERRSMQYLYNDGELYYFMDSETFEQIPINKSILNSNFKFVKENDECKVLSCNGNVFAVEPPLFAELLVTSTEPGVRGDTATNVTKPAILETGAEVRVPLFIDQGDKIKIDTRTGDYIERA
jgi:elongation factor P